MTADFNSPEAHALADKLDTALAHQQHINRIGELIDMWEDRDRIELLVEHGGGLIPARLHNDYWHVQGSLHAGVALVLEVEVPALRGSGDPDPVAYALAFDDVDHFKASESRFDPTPITDWAGDHFYVDLDGFRAGDELPLRLAIELLAAMRIPAAHGEE